MTDPNPTEPLTLVGDIDLHLIGEGRHERLWTVMGAHVVDVGGVGGTRFVVWAPAASAVSVIGDFNSWHTSADPMAPIGSSGLWACFVAGAGAGAIYRFRVVGADGVAREKSDPFAFRTEMPPANASVIDASAYRWEDRDWVETRDAAPNVEGRVSIYEVHVGSWRTVPEEDDRPLRWDELAGPLADHVEELGFTHVELMPVAEHPYTPSWGYQVSGYYAPTARYGTPDDFRAFVDTLHRRGVGVIVDWVPAHFPKDDWSLARFDGTSLYEHEDPRQGDHPDWGTHVFNYGRNEVRNFLIANALYWCEEFHIDGLRVDAVASMLYLDYSREDGEWVPNEHGGNENLDAISLMQELNTVMGREHPGVRMIAEESTAWGGVSRPVHLGGLGFGHKWNMGWMHDTLSYFQNDPIHRRYHHHQLTFGLVYAWSENFVLPLSHDEVVHGKGSLLTKMPGDRWQRFANVRSLFAWMWAHPGKQLLFMGSEFAQEREWSEARSLDWHLLDDDSHRGVQSLVRSLNAVAAQHEALWEQDNVPEGFSWLDNHDSDASVLSFLRHGNAEDATVACIGNFTPIPRHGYRIGLPTPGVWTEILNTDSAGFAGSDIVNVAVETEPIPWHGHEHSAVVALPPLAVLWLAAD